jgi:hypothetical protein
MDFRVTILFAAAMCLFPGLATAQAGDAPPQTRPVKRKVAHANGAATADEHKRNHAKPEAAPCARAAWKDDPICYGEGEPDALPLPSANSAQHGNPSPEPTIKPTANINPRPSGPGPYQAGVIYQSNGNAVTSNYGGGVSLQLPF